MMEKVKKLFFDTKMTWTTVIIAAAVCGIAVGLLMIPDFLINTSFQQPGISFEFWIFAALLIILNCEKPLEAGCKTFVFFLISQPLIYLVQVPFSEYHWTLFSYYPQWGLITLLTLPGAALGWYVKKGNLLSVFLLAVLNAILCRELPASVQNMVASFPRFLLSTLFILFELVVFNLILLKGRMRTISLALTAVLLTCSVCYHIWFLQNATNIYAAHIDQGTAPYLLIDAPEGVPVTVDGEYIRVELKQNDYRTVPIRLKDAEGEVVEVILDYSEQGVYWR